MKIIFYKLNISKNMASLIYGVSRSSKKGLGYVDKPMVLIILKFYVLIVSRKVIIKELILY